MEQELHVAGLVVHADPGRVSPVGRRLSAFAGTCVHAASEAGRLVVTLELPSAAQLARHIAKIRRMDGVFSAAVVFQWVDRLPMMEGTAS